MLKIYCDVCLKEVKPVEEGFSCTAQVEEKVVNLGDVPMPQIKKQQFNVCKDCYKKKIVKLFKQDDGKKEKK